MQGWTLNLKSSDINVKQRIDTAVYKYMQHFRLHTVYFFQG